MATDTDRSRAGTSPTKTRVLVVEDDIETARNLVRLLMKKGYDVQHAEDPESALNAFRGAHPKVMLVDATLPRKTGLQLGREIRALPDGGACGLVMITSSFKSGTIEDDALRAGFDAVFPKPIPVLDLLAKVEALATHGRPPPSTMPTPTPAGVTAAKSPTKSVKEPVRTQAAPPLSTSATASSGAASSVAASSGTASSGTASSGTASSGTTSTPRVSDAPNAAQNERAPSAPPPSPTPIAAGESALETLLVHARARATGVMRLRDGAALLEIALKNGVPVGAWDNLRENRLVERLQRSGALDPARIPLIEARMRESGERFVEACMALGILDESTALDALFAQLRGRVETAMLWAAGTVVFVPDARAVDDLAQGALDIVEAALVALLRHPERAPVERLRREHGGSTFVPTADFEAQLPSIARACPSSTLPQPFLAGRAMLTDVELCGEAALVELLVWLRLGIVKEERSVAPSSSLPVLLRAEREQVAFDVESARVVRETYLKWQGRTHYDVLGLSRDASKAEVKDAVALRHRTVGRDAFADRELGPAGALRRELVVMIESANETLTDDDGRVEYDLSLESALSFPRASAGHALEEEILQGRIYLSAGNVESAYEAFMRACVLVPNDVDAVAYLGYATLLLGREGTERARLILESALEMNPQATLPVFYLGLLAAREGRVDVAREFFLTAARRAPEDHEILAALAALDGITAP